MGAPCLVMPIDSTMHVLTVPCEQVFTQHVSSDSWVHIFDPNEEDTERWPLDLVSEQKICQIRASHGIYILFGYLPLWHIEPQEDAKGAAGNILVHNLYDELQTSKTPAENAAFSGLKESWSRFFATRTTAPWPTVKPALDEFMGTWPVQGA